MGVVQELIPCKDRGVHGAKVGVGSRGKTCAYARPAQKFLPVEIRSENEWKIPMLDDNLSQPARYDSNCS